ncbi:2,3-diphosphoglycerate-dependent phosphoglycerate mutase [candidate division WWE3 bacterium]|nr:2,3-diphosphoglycerate-dependent phosphoglycerate mutase [candidate division WWE3 bacterium]
MYKIVLLRHGQSEWNAENRFTGWTDVGLTEKGVSEAQRAGNALKEAGFTFDLVYTNKLRRAIKTAWISLEALNLEWIPVVKAWELNERHYGALQGLNKSEMAQKYGEEQVHIWRRSFDVRPPALTSESPMYPGNDPRYADIPKDKLPLTECLEDVMNRVIPYWTQHIAPRITEGKQILVAASGNSLRSLVKYLDNVPNEEIMELNIPTAIPLVYELDEHLVPIKHYYLADEQTLAKSIAEVKNQGKAK